jgi:hypothetical protein
VRAISKTTGRVVIAINPHKASWTAAVVDASSHPVATVRVPVSRDGYRALRRFASRWPRSTAVWSMLRHRPPRRNAAQILAVFSRAPAAGVGAIASTARASALARLVTAAAAKAWRNPG